MAITFDNSWQTWTYMFQAGATSTDGVWYLISGKTDTAAGYEWGGTQTFLNTVTTDATVVMRDGFNNFLNPAARDAAITSPIQGTLAFVRQDAGGGTINQIQYYTGSAWAGLDGDIAGVTAGTGLTGGGTSGTISLAVDTTVVATTSNTLTMTGKTLSAATLTGTLTAASTSGTNWTIFTNNWYWCPMDDGNRIFSTNTRINSTVTSGATITTISGLTDIVLNGPGSITG
jgi:hypothetical protein